MSATEIIAELQKLTHEEIFAASFSSRIILISDHDQLDVSPDCRINVGRRWKPARGGSWAD